MKRFLRVSSNLDKNELNYSDKKTYCRNEEFEKSIDENSEKNEFDYEILLADENIINNLIELEKSQASNNSNEGKKSIGKFHLHEKKHQTQKSTNLVKINDYLNAFNKQENIFLKEINIIDRRKNSDIAKLNYGLLQNKINPNLNEYYNNTVEYSEIRILNTYPLTILRIYKNESIDVIVLFNQLKPVRDKNDKLIIDAYLLDTKILKFKTKDNIDDTNKNKISNLNQYKNMNENQYFNKISSDDQIPNGNKSNEESFIRYQNSNKKIFIIENPNNPFQLVINYLSDLYILNLSFLKDISNKFIFEKTRSNNPDTLKKNLSLNITSDLIPIIKVNYSRIKDLNCKKFCFFGISLLNYESLVKSNMNSNNKEKISNRIIILGFNDKNKLFAKEYFCYDNIHEIFYDNQYFENRNYDSTNFVSHLRKEKDYIKYFEKFIFKIENFKRSHLNKRTLENINYIRKMYSNLKFL